MEQSVVSYRTGRPNGGRRPGLFFRRQSQRLQDQPEADGRTAANREGGNAAQQMLEKFRAAGPVGHAVCQEGEETDKGDNAQHEQESLSLRHRRCGSSSR